jgi:Sulfatase
MKAVLIHASAPILYIGAYGNEAVRTPTLDRLAAEGIVFDAHETDGGRPEQFLQVLLTGRPSFAARSTDPAVLLTQLEQAGATTALLTTRQFEPSDAWTLSDSLPGESLMTPIAEAVGAILDRLADCPDWLLVLDLDRVEQDQVDEDADEELEPEDEEELDLQEDSEEDAELIDDAPEEVIEESEEDESEPAAEDAEDSDEASADEEPDDPELQALLQGQGETAADAEDLDFLIGWLRTELEERGLWEEIVLIFTGQGDSAHPDGLCSAGPDHPLRPSLSRLPLIVRLPAAAHAGRRIAALTQPADLTATLLSWFGQPSTLTHASNLAPLCEGLTQHSRNYVCAVRSHGAEQALALAAPVWRFLLISNPERETRRWLFRQPEDRFGRMDFYQQLVDYADQLEACLVNYLAAAKQDGSFVAPELPLEQPPRQAPAKKGHDA